MSNEGLSDSAPAAVRQVLWRMQGPTRVVSAALFSPGSGRTELRVFFEPEAAGDLLSSQVEERPHRVKTLERSAERLRNALREQGWVRLPVPGSSEVPPEPGASGIRKLLKAGGIVLGVATLARWGWRRRSTQNDSPTPSHSEEAQN